MPRVPVKGCTDTNGATLSTKDRDLDKKTLFTSGFTAGGTGNRYDGPAQNSQAHGQQRAMLNMREGPKNGYPDLAQSTVNAPAVSDDSNGVRDVPLIAYKRSSPSLAANLSGSLSSIRVPTFKSEADQHREQKIGAKGELFVYNLLRELQGHHFQGPDCWTSELRPLASKDHGRWTPDDLEGDYADFTVVDGNGAIAMFLQREHGITLDHDDNTTTFSHGRTFHIEVKSTAGLASEIFHMSSNQMEMAGRLTGEKNNSDVFMIFRVLDVESDEPNLLIYLDPYKTIQDGALTAQADGWLVLDPGLNSPSAAIVSEEEVEKYEADGESTEDEENAESTEDEEYGEYGEYDEPEEYGEYEEDEEYTEYDEEEEYTEDEDDESE